MDEKLLSYIKKYLISFVIMGLSSSVILFLREANTADAPEVMYLNLADAFTIPSVIIVMVGLLVWLSTQGTFDMLSYGFKRGAGSVIPLFKGTEERFYDYKVRMDKKRASGYSFLFISGGIYFIPAIVFNILYYTL